MFTKEMLPNNKTTFDYAYLKECHSLQMPSSLVSFCDENENYHKIPKISDTRKFAVIILKVEQDGFSLE